MAYELGDIVLERTLESTDSKGKSGTIKLRFGLPYKVEDVDIYSESWHCQYQILGIGLGRVHAGRGRDAIEALFSSLRVAEILIKSHKDVKVTWQGEEELGLQYPSLEEILDRSEYVPDDDSPFKKAFEGVFRNCDKKQQLPPASTDESVSLNPQG